MAVVKGFGQRLEAEIAGRKKGEFAKAIGVRPHQLSRYLKGQVPDSPVLTRIATETGRSIDWLLLGKKTQQLEEALRQAALLYKKLDTLKIPDQREEWDKIHAQLSKLVSKTEREVDLLVDAKGISGTVDVPAPPGYVGRIRELLTWFSDCLDEDRELLLGFFECIRDADQDTIDQMIGQMRLYKKIVHQRVQADPLRKHIADARSASHHVPIFTHETAPAKPAKRAKAKTKTKK